MSENNGTGIIYPTLTLGGIEYTIKFTRGALLYRMSKIGVNLLEFNAAMGFSRMIDILYAVMSPAFPGAVEDLADLVIAEEKSLAVGTAIREAMGKAFPPTQVAAGTAGTTAAVQ